MYLFSKSLPAPLMFFGSDMKLHVNVHAVCPHFSKRIPSILKTMDQETIREDIHLDNDRVFKHTSREILVDWLATGDNYALWEQRNKAPRTLFSARSTAKCRFSESSTARTRRFATGSLRSKQL